MKAPDAVDSRPLLSSEDIACGFVGGLAADSCLPRPSSDPAKILASAIRRALKSAPCVIGFSGGRDSSLLLAAAVHEARGSGLAMPIAATLEFDSEKTWEREWQELVVAHLGIEDWVRLPQGDDLDFVGPVARDGLIRHGLLYPANAHMVVPLAAVAGGGSVVTGFGGDDVLGGWPFEDAAAALARRRSLRRSDVRAFAHWAQPAGARTARYAKGRDWVQLPWLRAPHRSDAARRIARDVAGSPRTWSARMRWLARRRIWEITQRAMDLHASAHGVRTYAPLLDHMFLVSLGEVGGRLGLGDRTAVTRLLAGGRLPASLVERETKAEFSESYFGVHTRRFAKEWDGSSGVDPEVVDADSLRAEWLSEHPHGLSAALLQSAWLATHGRDGETAVRSVAAHETSGVDC